MNTPNDRIWDELGVAWRAVQIDTTALSGRLRRQLRRETWRRRCEVALSLIAGAIVVFCSVELIRTHKGAWPTVAIVCSVEFALTILAAIATWIHRPPSGGDTDSLMGMLNLSISRAAARRREMRIARYAAPPLFPIGAAVLLFAARAHGWWLLIDTLIILTSSVFTFFSVQRQYRESCDHEARLLHLRRELVASEHGKEESVP